MFFLNKKELENFLSNNTQQSSMRLLFFRTVSVALFLSVISVIVSLVAIFFDKKVDLLNISAIIGVLLTTAFGGKSIQSFAEHKDINKNW